MPLDVHVAASQKQAEVKRREFFIDEVLHELIFTKYSSIAVGMKHILRISDYYSDASFQGADVSAVESELRSLASSVSEQSLREMLTEFANVCNRAAARRENVYLFGD